MPWCMSKRKQQGAERCVFFSRVAVSILFEGNEEKNHWDMGEGIERRKNELRAKATECADKRATFRRLHFAFDLTHSAIFRVADRRLFCFL